MRQFFVYILSSRSRNLYVGVTNNLERRIWEHRNGLCSFTFRYRIHRLVYYEAASDPISAIRREKRLKRSYRAEKVALIERGNPTWKDLAADWLDGEPADPPAALRAAEDDN